jgi:hypothetical protein
MRCTQDTHDEAPIARFCPLSMWVGVEVVGRSKFDESQLIKTQGF